MGALRWHSRGQKENTWHRPTVKKAFTPTDVIPLINHSWENSLNQHQHAVLMDHPTVQTFYDNSKNNPDISTSSGHNNVVHRSSTRSIDALIHDDIIAAYKNQLFGAREHFLFFIRKLESSVLYCSNATNEAFIPSCAQKKPLRANDRLQKFICFT